jgi:hypothetical protein
MRRPDEKCNCTPRIPGVDADNAFRDSFFEALLHRDPEPAVPGSDLAGPWRVTRLHGDGPPLWAVYGFGERAPRFTFDEPDLAYLAATALALAERPARFRFQRGADDRTHLMHDGEAIATTPTPELEHTTLASDLTRLADLRAQPQALAHLLSAVPLTVLRKVGAILADEVRRTG